MDITVKQIIGVNRTLSQIIPELVGLMGVYTFHDLSEEAQNELIQVGLAEDLLDREELMDNVELEGVFTLLLQNRISNFNFGNLIAKEAKKMIGEELHRMIETEYNNMRGYLFSENEEEFLFNKYEAQAINQANTY